VRRHHSNAVRVTTDDGAIAAVVDRLAATRSLQPEESDITMEWIETTGRTIEVAKEQALELLGVEEVEVEFEVLDEGKSGFFGIGGREARVRARLRPRVPAPKRERRRGRRRRGGSEKGAAAAAAEGGAESEVDVAQGEGLVTTDAGTQHQRGSLSRVELAARAQSFLAGLMQEFGLAGEVRVVRLDDEWMELSIEGENLGVLVGSRAVVLDAIQELTRSVLQAVAGEGVGRVVVDVAGYRQRRREALERFAREQALIALETGEERVLEPMSPADRKVVHDVVAALEGLATRSEGEEPERYVVIYRTAEQGAIPETADAGSHQGVD
jgi:spoIIIJ-associated protein